MPQGWPVMFDRSPLLAAEKHYFHLDAAGHLQYYLFNRSGEHREKLSGDLFQQKIYGFDAAVDSQGAVHLLGYEPTGGLFYLALPRAGQNTPLLFYRDQHKTIDHLSACRDQNNNLHLLYLTHSERHKMWWLFYLGSKQQGGQHHWMEPVVVDFGYGPPGQYGLIGTDFRDRLFVLYRLFSAGKYSLVFRPFTGTPPRPGRTVFLQEEKKTKEKEECFFPSFFVDPDNTLHLSWPAHQEKTMFLNYACCDPAGKWGNFLSLEIPPDSFLLAPLFRHEHKLFLIWKRKQTLFYLFLSAGKEEKPEDEGKLEKELKQGMQESQKKRILENWHRGKNQKMTGDVQLIRLRPADGPAENIPFRGFRGFSLFTTAGSPPQGMLQPEDFAPRVLETVNTAGNKEKENILPELIELHALDILTSYTLTRASNLQTTNAYLKQKLEERGKEFSRLYAVSLTQKENLAEQLASKKIELEKIEELLQQTLAELQKRLQQQKEEIMNLQAECRALQKENEGLKKKEFLLAANLAQLKEEITLLTGEKEALKVERLRKPPFLGRLLHKIRCQFPPNDN